jgi:hypothetical protein
MSIFTDHMIREAVREHREACVIGAVKAGNMENDGAKVRKDLDNADELLIERIRVLLTAREEAVRENL